MNSPSLSSRRVNGKNIDLDIWKTPDEGALSEEIRAQYFSRKEAVKLYLDGASEKTIRKRASIGLKQVYRLIRERCLEIHSDGCEYGWRGLIPNLRIQQYRRKTKIKIDAFGHGAAGSMQSLLDRHSDLRRAFDKRILSAPSRTELGQVKKSRLNHVRWFLDELRKLGYEQRIEWPFNTENTGYQTVCRYIDALMKANPKMAVQVLGGPDLAKKMLSGDGVDRPVKKFMQRVEMDAHKLDGRFCVSLPQPTGGYKEKIIHRIWVIVIVEIMSRAVLGYYLSLRREVSKEDVLAAIKCALTTWVPREISFNSHPYCEDAGLLSSAGDDFVGLCWDEMSVDGAMAQTCETVKGALQDVVKSVLLEPRNSFAIRRSKDDRPYIETYFRTLSGQGFQRLSNTTGAKPADKKGRNPDQIALTSKFQYEYAEELLDVLIANYNATSHSSIGYRTPRNYARFLFTKNSHACRYAEPLAVQMILSVRKKCIVKGGITEGRAPFVNFFNARYTNSILQTRYDLVGQEIWVINHLENDARVALASTSSGNSLGILRAAAPWNGLPHSLRVRSAIYSFAVKSKLQLPVGTDAVESFLNYVESQSDKKLPVHVAYLELRRILVKEKEKSLGESLLNIARQKTLQEGAAPNERQQPTKEAQGAAQKRSEKRPLPPMRMTASE